MDLVDVLDTPVVPEPVFRTSATMDLLITTTTITIDPFAQKKKQKKSPIKSKVVKTMTLSEYQRDKRRKIQELENPTSKPVEKPTTTKNKTTKKKNTEKKTTKNKNTDKGWTTVSKKRRSPKKRQYSKSKTNRHSPKKRRFINTTLILKNLPFHGTSESELKNRFQRCGPIKFINILQDDQGKCKGIAFIRFETQDGSDKGLLEDGFWYDNRQIYVEYAKDRRERN
jgi:hypothetical protein